MQNKRKYQKEVKELADQHIKRHHELVKKGQIDSDLVFLLTSQKTVHINAEQYEILLKVIYEQKQGIYRKLSEQIQKTLILDLIRKGYLVEYMFYSRTSRYKSYKILPVTLRTFESGQVAPYYPDYHCFDVLLMNKHTNKLLRLWGNFKHLMDFKDFLSDYLNEPQLNYHNFLRWDLINDEDYWKHGDTEDILHVDDKIYETSPKDLSFKKHTKVEGGKITGSKIVPQLQQS